MDCKLAREALSAALDGEVTPEERSRLEAHLASCASCRALREELMGLHAACAHLDAQPPAQLREQILTHLPPQRPARPSSAIWRRWGAMAAAFVLVATAAWRLPRLLQNNSVQSGNAAPAAPGVEETLPAQTDVQTYGSVSPTPLPDPSAYVENDAVSANSVLGAGAVSPSPEPAASFSLAPDETARKEVAPEGGLPSGEATQKVALRSAVVSPDSAPAEPQDAGTETVSIEEIASAAPPETPVATASLTLEASLFSLAPDPDRTDAAPEGGPIPDPDEERPEPLPEDMSREDLALPAAERETPFSLPDVYCGVLTLGSGSLLGDYPSFLQDDGSVWYCVPAQRFYALLSQLSRDESAVPYTLRNTGEDLSPSADYGLVIFSPSAPD